MDSNSQWDRAQEEWRQRPRQHVPDHHWTGQKVTPTPEPAPYEPVADEPMPDYDAGEGPLLFEA